MLHFAVIHCLGKKNTLYAKRARTEEIFANPEAVDGYTRKKRRKSKIIISNARGMFLFLFFLSNFITKSSDFCGKIQHE